MKLKFFFIKIRNKIYSKQKIEEQVFLETKLKFSLTEKYFSFINFYSFQKIIFHETNRL
jgi:hypothetical protein